MTVPARRSNVAGIVLAAGQSTRFGRNKLIEPLLGMPLVRRVVEAALRSSLSSVTVVLGHDGDTVRATLAGLSDATRLKFAINPSYRKGQSTSVAAGLATVPAGSAGAMFLVGDQPFIDCSTIDRLVAAFEAAGGGICYPVRNGRRCNPVIFGAEFLADLRQLSGDVGGRAVIEANREAAVAVEFSDAALLDDIEENEFDGKQLGGDILDDEDEDDEDDELDADGETAPKTPPADDELPDDFDDGDF